MQMGAWGWLVVGTLVGLWCGCPPPPRVESSARAAPALLRVTTEPAGAQITVDGQPSGASPAQVRVSLGLHRLEVSLGGYLTSAQSVEVAAGELSVHVPLMASH